jgi:hypothetical protein
MPVPSQPPPPIAGYACKMYRLISFFVIIFILTGALLCSCDSKITDNPCDTCQNPCDTCIPCDTCDTTQPCDTCDTTNPTPNDTTSHDFIWIKSSINTEGSITGTQIWGENEIWVSGKSLYRWSGNAWEEQLIKTVTNRPLNGGGEGVFQDVYFFGFNPNNFWFASGDVVYNALNKKANEYRLVELGILTFPNDGGINSCWGTSSSDMFFVGDKGTILHFNGTNWTKFSKVVTKNLRSVWGTSSSDVWAAGFDESTAQSVLLHYDGSSWLEQDLKQIGDIEPLHHALGEVWATDSAGHKIVVTSGSLLHRQTDNGLWRSDSGLIQNRLNDGYFIGLWDIRGNNINDFCAAGDGGFISHWNGKSWKRYDELYDPNNIFYATRALHQKGNTICVVGKKNGASWIAVGRRK